MRRRGAKPHSSRRPRASGSGGTIGQRQNRAGAKHLADLQGAAVVVLIPCLNEEHTVGKVVRDFRREAPFARIVVCDNGSIDQSVEAARQAGAEVVSESKRGKGHVIQSMFRTVRADAYLLVDGDDTYPAEAVTSLLAPVLAGQADMAVGSRTVAGAGSEFRRLNWAGNAAFRVVTNLLFPARLTDVLSGYRCLSRRLVAALPLFEGGFGVEAEITIKSLERGFRVVEVPVRLRPRPKGSASKIRVVRDGVTILATIGGLFRDYKPLTFFGGLGALLLLSGGAWLAARWPDANGPSLAMVVLPPLLLTAAGGLLIAVGLILHTLNRRFQELEHLLQVGGAPPGEG